MATLRQFVKSKFLPLNLDALAKVLRWLPKAIMQRIRRQLFFPSVRGWRRTRSMPIAMITGTKGKSTTTRMLANILTHAGHQVGYSCTDGVVINGQYTANFDAAGYWGSHAVLMNPQISAAVLEIARGSLMVDGMFLKKCPAAALLNVGREQIGIDGIETVEEMAQLKRRVIDAAQDTVVLNADDRCLKQLIPDYDSGKLVLFSMCQDNLAVDAHILNGGSALVLDTFKQHEHIVRVAKGSRESIIALNDLPSCYGGIFQQNIANAMAAAALAYGLGISVASIRKGLASFENSLEQSPGRLNLISGYSQTILLDAEASPAAAQPLIKSLLKFETRQPAVCMFYSMGNRADWHFTELCEILGSFFERFVCYETEKTRRGREPNEINGILKTRLMATGISECNISLASGYDEATATLAHLASDGDLVVLLAPNAAELMPIFRKNFSMHKSGKE